MINFLHHFWPSLLANEFLQEFITPIVKASNGSVKSQNFLDNFQGKQRQTFFTIPEYENWKKSLGEEEVSHWKIKYYKGLGTRFIYLCWELGLQ